ncbi:hypothetical protein OIE68_13180 [Nocardia vinacea]|uniref:carbonic anhydrase n=1 Tax=Nocardia vinacea TaxID=96468 RepID=UPI002E121484|nr:hypothetical protein OIE68_13180 [Nocardia vinacea]
MKALLAGTSAGPRLDAWLAHARPSLDAYRAEHPVRLAATAAGYDEAAQLSMVNVAVQLETLQHHPVMRGAVAERGLTVSGLFFDISTACVLEVTADGISQMADQDATAPVTV